MRELLQLILATLHRGDCPDTKYPDQNGEYWPLCPYHPDKQSGSFQVSERGFRCFACGESGGLSKLAEKLGIEVWQCGSVAAGDQAPPPPPTLEEYAKYKNLPLDFLTSLGLETVHLKGKPAIKIPYYDSAGDEAVVRFRLTLQKGQKDARFKWRNGSKGKIIPYGLWRLSSARHDGYVLLVEGESDCQTLWFYGIPALGIPGASNWRKEWADYLAGFEVYLWQEPDMGGETLTLKVGTLMPDIHIITPPSGRKDVSEAHLLGDDVLSLITNLRSQARSYIEIERERLNIEAAEAKAKAATLLNTPNILDEVVNVGHRLGLVGEDNIAKLLYLAITSRLLDRPVNVVIKGPSSGGKSFTVETVLKMFPPTAYYALSSMSDRALVYSQEPLAHRFLVLYEAAGMKSDFGTYLIRTLLSEGCIRYETVEKTSAGLIPKLIEREGPTGLIVTTTWASLHPENETRMFSLTVKDDPFQTRAVLGSLADRANGKTLTSVNLSSWHGLQTWLELAGCRSVTIPFARQLAEKANPKAVRLRRDFSAVLTLIATHAMLHQTQRERSPDGRIIATLDDYRVIYTLISDILSEGVQAAVSEILRETVNAVKRIYERLSNMPVSLNLLADELRLDKSATARRVKVAIKEGYLSDEETGKGRPSKLTLADDLPEATPVLPSPDSLERGGDYISPLQQCNSATVYTKLDGSADTEAFDF